MKIGPYEIVPIPTGVFGLDGGAMFGTVPKVLWERSNPADEKNRIEMEARALLLKSPGRNILIDCGNGSDFVAKYGEKAGAKFAEIYGVQSGDVSLLSSLRAAGLEPKDITDVILTHLHFDHAGGGVTADRDGHLIPTFPNATYYVQEANLLTAQKPNIREKASYLEANYKPLMDKKILRVISGPTENLLPGVSVFISNGHTVGQGLVKISDGQTTMIYCGDLVPTGSHVRLAWIMGYDLDPLLLITEKERLLSQAADQGWYLFFEHDPKCAYHRVERNGADFKLRA